MFKYLVYLLNSFIDALINLILSKVNFPAILHNVSASNNCDVIEIELLQ